MSGPSVAAARVELVVDGVPLYGAAAAGVTAVTVDARIDRPAQCRITTVAADGASGLSLGAGVPLLVRTGEDGPPLFDGVVTAIERAWHPRGMATVTVRAHDRLGDLRQGRTSEAVVDRNPVEVAAAVADRRGLVLQTHVDVAGRPVTGRFGETDLAFLRRLLERTGLHLAVRARTLHLFGAEGIGAPVTLRVGHELRSLAVDERLDLDADDVGVTAWHLDDAEVHAAGGGSHRSGWVLDSEAGATLARAMAEHRRQRTTVATGVAEGDPRLAPGARIRVGADGELSRPLLVTVVEHLVDVHAGFRTRFSTEPLDPEPAPAPATWTLGVVEDVDDPQGSGRVQVALSAHGDQRTHWLPVVLPGLGAGKGVVALPDVGDRVVVLGQADDPGTGVVLGGILGATPITGEPVVDGATRRLVLRLPGGSSVAIDDAAATVVVDNGAGSRLELGAERAVLHSATDLEVAAPGRRILLRAAAIDMEHAP